MMLFAANEEIFAANDAVCSALQVGLQDRDREVWEPTLSILIKLTAVVDNRMPMGDSAVREILPVLVEVMTNAARVRERYLTSRHLMSSDNTDYFSLEGRLLVPSVTAALALALRVTYQLSQLESNHVQLASPELGVVSLLRSISSANNVIEFDKEAVTVSTLASDILRNLATQRLNDIAAEIKAVHGVDLELFVMCAQYQLNVLDGRIKEEGGEGLAGVNAFKMLIEEKARLHSAADSALELRMTLPREFLSLRDRAGQARWIQAKLSTYSTELMKAFDAAHLSAFARFLHSLPLELQLSAHDTPYAVVSERNFEWKDQAVVDGVYHDGPTTTPVKIKLRRMEHKTQLMREYNMMVKLHKSAPAVVATPFALVQSSDR